MRRAASGAAVAALLGGPTVLAFFSGGYFDGPRAWAGLAVWVLVALAMVLVPRPFPRSRGGRIAVAGLALLAVWTLLSTLWAPLAGSAYHAGQIVVLYLGAILAGGALLRDRAAQRAVEPALALGVLVVIGYAISERLLPGLLHFARSVSAQGRLEQPLTYWNATGELAAIGFVLVARLAGDVTRPRSMRVGAAAASAVLGLGLYLSFSRGALFAAAGGFVALVVLAPTRQQLAGLGIAILAAALASLAASPFGGVTSLAGRLSTRESQGATVLVALVVIALLAGAAQLVIARRLQERPLRLPSRTPWIAGAVVCAGLALAIVVGAKEGTSSGHALSGGAARLGTLQSNRYAYWGVAIRAFGQAPIRGVGAGGWAVDWLRWRKITEFANDAHSLPLQTMAELGLIGLAMLLAFFGGLAMAAHRALSRAPGLAAGPFAALAVYVLHSPLDWDWQMPAVTLVATVLGGMLIATAGPRPAVLAPDA